ncbi:olfactory receptor 2T11-like [Pyxicephalus adspersus]|uniref:olfactory receptor 2T11-like n=1 Tax=Pyxicephalus adspersus TaxID=30357 RepID=UPI003B596FFE
MLLSIDNRVSLAQCFTQMFFFFLASGAEDILLAVMAYDRYVAICKPLRYTKILNRRNCLHIMTGLWVAGCLNSIIFTMSACNMTFCGSNTIQQLYCDSKALTKIACDGTEPFNTVMYLEMLVFGLGSFLCSLTSYIKIITIIFRMKSEVGKKKVFSTCSSHLTVLMLYYSTAGSVYLMPQSKQFHLLDQVLTALYSTVTPILNPLIYSLRNQDVVRAFLRLIQLKDKCRSIILL